MTSTRGFVRALRDHRHEILVWFSSGLVCVLIASALVPSTAEARKTRHRPRKPRKHLRHRDKRHHGSSHGRNSSRKLPPIVRTRRFRACPPEMVNVAGRFCIDRWESMSVDARTAAPLSPYYPPHPRLAHMMYARWKERVEEEFQQARRLALEAGVPDPWWSIDASDETWWKRLEAFDAGTADAPSWLQVLDAGPDRSAPLVSTPWAPWGWVRLGDAGEPDAPVRPAMQLPALPPWQMGKFEAKAVSRPDVIPQGYTPGFVAERACRRAGKRLCREEEWVFACKGEKGTKFPYGPSYRQGKCNVFRPSHPAMILHGSFSIGLSDPRLNLVEVDGKPLLRPTGHTRSCVSRWGNDGIYDMVGNVDEWVDDPSGVFVGGFYARNTRNGCEARVSNHPRVYFDYSLGYRCCADLVGGDGDGNRAGR